MKKGRHRRFEEARALKRSNEDLEDVVPDVFGEQVGTLAEPCAECGAQGGAEHASWCLASEYEEDEELEEVE